MRNEQDAKKGDQTVTLFDSHYFPLNRAFQRKPSELYSGSNFDYTVKLLDTMAWFFVNNAQIRQFESSQSSFDL